MIITTKHQNFDVKYGMNTLFYPCTIGTQQKAALYYVNTCTVQVFLNLKEKNSWFWREGLDVHSCAQIVVSSATSYSIESYEFGRVFYFLN
jgi:hypothetical protein